MNLPHYLHPRRIIATRPLHIDREPTEPIPDCPLPESWYIGDHSGPYINDAAGWREQTYRCTTCGRIVDRRLTHRVTDGSFLPRDPFRA